MKRYMKGFYEEPKSLIDAVCRYCNYQVNAHKKIDLLAILAILGIKEYDIDNLKNDLEKKND